ncbi:MAG: FAD binding domain-containing protein [Candidatus Binatus sp.]|uniref:FAD binding domain-containing protein n=1 Tax=Candidatus Binatus sp. TaxID=2811406 RepID=UPI0027238E6B|nr:FAD binding domain-containing protein [Candidatus Binatus sp.]MDO8432467.1 FAD binding domain-containing protein [Candidatus Binatus sp.]
MDLNTIGEIARPNEHDGKIDWRDGDAWLAGGTWLFSEPQPQLRRLIDLQGLGWEPLTVSGQGLEIAATCQIAKLYALTAPADWTAAPLIGECCRAFLSSFKIWNTATVGGNVCMSLPAGPMISLTVALEGTCRIMNRDGVERRVAVEAFVTGNHMNVLQPGDLLRSIELPAAALRKRFCFRRVALTHLGRSTALLVGTLDPQDGVFMLTISASTERPHRLKFSKLPGADDLRARLEHEIPKFFDDVHGTPDYRKHMTFHFAEEIQRDLSGKVQP